MTRKNLPEDSSNNLLELSLFVGGKKLRVLVDSGATHSFVSAATLSTFEHAPLACTDTNLDVSLADGTVVPSTKSVMF